MQYQEFIAQSLAKAADTARGFYGKVTPSTKEGDNNQVLTEADIAIGKQLIAEINRVFPEHNIIDEEAGVIDRHSEFTWVIDPIDGTSNFANSIPTYGIMLGLLDGATPIAGGVALPFFEDIYTAFKGEGAFKNEQQIHVTTETDLKKMLVAYGIDGHQEQPQLTYAEARIVAELCLHIRNLRTTNSVFDLMMVAQGSFGGCINQTSKIWDNVAQQVILEEAGAIYTDAHGQPQDYTQPLTKASQNFTFCTAPAALHQQLQVIMHS